MAYMFNASGYYASGVGVEGTVISISVSSLDMAQGYSPTASTTYILQSEEDTANWSTKNGWHLLLGTGDTPPTKDDFKLAAQASTLKPITRACVNSTIKNSLSTSGVVTNTFANYTSEPVIVKEIGLYFLLNSTSSGSTNGIMLAAREVLPEPITMNPGDIRTFQMTLDFSNI